MLPDEEDEYDIPVDQMDGMGDGVDAFANVGQGLVGEHKTEMLQYWQRIIDDIERISDDGMDSDVFKSTVLPLARIKKVMKTDSEVRMISAEAPILFAKGCDIFITELTMRAWIHAEENKRRTLQRSDIATAIQRSDIFDFLIDIVPREEAQPRRTTQRLTEYHAPESVVPPPQDPMQGQAMLGQIPGATNPMLQMPGQILGQMGGQMQGQIQGQMPGQLQGQMPGQMPSQTPNQAQMPNGSNQKLGQVSPNQNQLPPHMAGQMMNMPPIPASLSGQVPAHSMANLGTLSDVAINTLDLSTMNMGNLQMPPENMSLPTGMSGFNGAPNDPRLQELKGQRPDQPDQRPNELSNPDISDAGTEQTESNAEAQRAQKKQKPNDQSDELKLERKDDNFPGSPRYESAELQFSPSYQPDGVDVGAYQEY